MVRSPGGGNSDHFAASGEVCQHGFDAVLVDRAQAGPADAQSYPAVLALDPEAPVLAWDTWFPPIGFFPVT
jgi:hypothetical protein